MPSYIAYYRVSTDRQGQSGLGLEAQRSAIERFLRDRSGELMAEFTDIMSGARNDRPELASALALCKKKRAILIVAKLDRLARNVAFISRLMEASIDFVAVDNPHANRLTVHLLAAIAEHERELISTRTKEAMAAAKARGVKFGWAARESREKMLAAARRSGALQATRADAHALRVWPHIRDIRAAGIRSYRAIARQLNGRGVLTAMGRQWHARTVIDLEQRLANAMGASPCGTATAAATSSR